MAKSTEQRAADGKTSQQKGAEFEIRFAEYMKSDLGYHRYKVRKSMPSKDNPTGNQADIIATVLDKRGRRFLLAAIIIALVGFIISILFILDFIDYFYLVIGAVMCIGSISYMFIGHKLSDKYTWVECKDRKVKTTVNDIGDLIRKVNENNASKHKKETIHKMIYVSNGFVDAGEQFAREHKIDCYEIKDGSFVKSNYWS